jgi:hypothetical protein
MRVVRSVLFASCVACACTTNALAGPVSLTIRGGSVTLVSQNATVRQILAEWSRVGRTTIVNLDRIPGGPVSIELYNVTEAQALTVVLRGLGGFVAAPRASFDPQVSQFDRIVVMPVLATAAIPLAVAPRRMPPQASPRPQPGDWPDDTMRRRPSDPDAGEGEQEGEANLADRAAGAPPEGGPPGSATPPSSTATPGVMSPSQTLRPGLPTKPGGDAH